MSDSVFGFVDGTHLLVDLQRVNDIVKSFSGCLIPEEIALRVTNGLVEKFDCAFARIWLVEADRTGLKLVASSGLYTRTDGSFARVPMGAFKVGKIAQNQIPFLSNQLAEETWVKDRAWAIAHGIQGFAGYPLAIAGNVIGVLAVFSQQVMDSEFLEVLQSLCTTTTICLEAALDYQQEKQVWQTEQAGISPSIPIFVPLSEQLAHALKTSQLTLVGTERSLTTSLKNLFLGMAEVLSQHQCVYNRLTYASEYIALEAMITGHPQTTALRAALAEVQFASVYLGGMLQILEEPRRGIFQVVLTVPYAHPAIGTSLTIQCRSAILQLAFTRLAYLAGFAVSAIADPDLPLVTDDPALAQTVSALLWIDTGTDLPKQARAKLNLSLTPQQFRQAVAAVQQGEGWGIEPESQTIPTLLSDREREIMTLLTQGLRDRDIASRLIISESTVKFHMNNILTKLKARTRFQALYQALSQGWLT